MTHVLWRFGHFPVINLNTSNPIYGDVPRALKLLDKAGWRAHCPRSASRWSAGRGCTDPHSLPGRAGHFFGPVRGGVKVKPASLAAGFAPRWSQERSKLVHGQSSLTNDRPERPSCYLFVVRDYSAAVWSARLSEDNVASLLSVDFVSQLRQRFHNVTAGNDG